MNSMRSRIEQVARSAARKVRPPLTPKPRDLKLPLAVVGPSWFVEGFDGVVDQAKAKAVLLGPNADPDELAEDLRTLPQVGFRNPIVEDSLPDAPVINLGRANPIFRRGPTSSPPEVERLVEAAVRTLPARRSDSERDTTSWLTDVKDAHRRYRDATNHDAASLAVDALILAAVDAEPIDDSVTVVCVTNRPGNLKNLLANYRRQSVACRALIVVTNSDDFDKGIVAETLDPHGNEEAVHLPEDWSLGRCLNVGLDMADGRFFAKFDDDDIYCENYLEDMIRTHHFAESAVVGKHSYFSYLEDSAETILRFPDREFTFTRYVAGGTLVIDTHRTGLLRFEDRSIGEDAAFLRSVSRKGLAIVSSDCFNYLQTRHSTNTWKISNEEYSKKSLKVSSTRAMDFVAT